MGVGGELGQRRPRRCPDAELPALHSSPSKPRRSETIGNFAAFFMLLRPLVKG